MVELIVVIAILGLLASMAIGEFYHRRQEAYNKQALSFGRNLLTVVASAAANDELPAGLATGLSPGAVPGFDELKGNPGIWVSLEVAANDVYKFHMAAVGGDTAYYFWLPGPSCPFDTDGDGFLSDTLIDNRDAPGFDWRTNPLLM